ncbi:PIN domain-containing protein [Brevibacterium sp. 'Marine']|uniref:PIN domain-containing protein n=1 Tax=Brevibacterium sp. 'Marine' TaxID=2725563 RepID=UPI00145EE4FE|nr:PIN domain-containing protein [Brevibacterium sp. 'Marine']
MPQRVFVDANIFSSRTLLDWMFHLRQANEGMFQLHSTEDVFDEVIQDFPGSGEFSGQDPKDYHVHAAALAAGSDFIVSADDPSDITTTPDAQPYDVVSPDDFFLLVVDSSPDRILPITRSQYEYWKSRPRYRQLDEALLRAGCQQFATRVRSALSELAQIPD